jgi:hypothetical protein
MSDRVSRRGEAASALHEFEPGIVLRNRGDVKEIWRDGDLVASIERSQGSFLRRVWVARTPSGERLCSGKDLAAVAHRAARIG